MGLELDTLKNNEDMVIYNNTTGEITPLYDKKHLITIIEKMGYKPAAEYFEEEEIDDFIREWQE